MTIGVRSNRGETYTYVFPNLQQAIKFMQSYHEARDMDTSNAPALFMGPEVNSQPVATEGMKLNLNTATKAEFMNWPGIGKRIRRHPDKEGALTTVKQTKR